ncbi:MAG: hypothetical protein K8R23_06185 [Chthoniobacter sp.]|nr:hypothetical protein [Chthoniobacter sp.]
MFSSIRVSTALLAASLCAVGTDGRGEEVRQWTCPPGKPFAAEIVAADGLRATLLVPGRGKTVVPFALLSPADVAYVREWRARNRRAPLIDPERIAPWPAEAVVENVEVRVVAEDTAGGRYSYESAHFTVESDLKLPVPVVRDIVTVFEATRAALIALPLGLLRGEEEEKYAVAMFSTAAAYQAAGGIEGSGGYFDGASRRMLIDLPNLGIKKGANGLTLDFQKQIFVLKHEVTHQLLGRWSGWLPVWLNEGFAECMAATPYTRGRYALQNLDGAMHDYLLKWRATPDRRELLLIPPARLMVLSPPQWRDEVKAVTAYPLYNSSALLAYYFLHHDVKGDGVSMAAYFDALRRGVPPENAEAEHLLHGRTRESLTPAVQALCRKLALPCKMETR